jgi:S1-C subfamily serine protease
LKACGIFRPGTAVIALAVGVARNVLRGTPGAILILAPILSTQPAGPAGIPDPKLSVLPPLKVSDEAICRFGFSFTCRGDLQTSKISRLLITDIQQGSRADRLGLVAGDEILAVDGIKVTDLKGGLGRSGDLMRLFVNRKDGEKIKLGLWIRGSTYVVTLTAKASSRPVIP